MPDSMIDEGRETKVDFDIIWKAAPDGKRHNRTASGAFTPEQYDAIQFFAHHPSLPFDGSVSYFLRQGMLSYMAGLTVFLGDGERADFQRLRALQKRVSDEDRNMRLESSLGLQVHHLQEWTAEESWSQVASDLAVWAAEISEMSTGLARRAAQSWISNRDVKVLLRVWETKMARDDPRAWHRVQRIMERWGARAGL